ncbi:MAG: indole-3-glycerol phosphate synthase TrpC [Candidatus Binatia bacterium]|nr:indole-3-glycerol phosphate synthase TrpC [Candidatus Binatia bacterium]
MILDRILEAKRAELADTKQRVPLAELTQVALYHEPRRDFVGALQRQRAIIAEVKQASPSRGVMRQDFNPVGLARAYEAGGAAAISVLTETQFFLGHLQHLQAIRRAVRLPLLRKDFLFDPYQLHEARAYGADAVLLIVRALATDLLRELIEGATALGLAALVEVHGEGELEVALAAGARLIGVNNRDLGTFVTSLGVTERVAARVRHQDGLILVAESGIDSRDDIERLERAGVHAFLIGEALVRANDPAAKLAALLA